MNRNKTRKRSKQSNQGEKPSSGTKLEVRRDYIREVQCGTDFERISKVTCSYSLWLSIVACGLWLVACSLALTSLD